MNKQEFLKIQTCVLKVNIHCDGCKHKVKKILQKIEGVYTIKIDSEMGKVTVSGNVDSGTLIKKLIKNGKHAELWGVPKMKNLQVGGGNSQKGGGHSQKGSGGNNPGKVVQNPQLLQQMKGLQGMKFPVNQKEQNQKMSKLSLQEDDEFSDDDFDDSEGDYSDYSDEDDDDVSMKNKMKPVVGNGHGGSHMPNMMKGNLPQLMKAGAGNGGGGGGNGKDNGGGKGGQIGNFNGNGAMKGGVPNGMAMNGGVAQMNQMGQMKNLPMSNFGPTRGPPPSGGPGGGAMGHFQGSEVHNMDRNNQYQQQLAAMMMNQQRANGNERFQPMMYARPPPTVNYMPAPYPPYPYPPPPGERVDQYAMFSDENTDSCVVM